MDYFVSECKRCKSRFYQPRAQYRPNEFCGEQCRTETRRERQREAVRRFRMKQGRIVSRETS